MNQTGGDHSSSAPSGGPTNHVTLLRRLVATLPTIEEAGCDVGSGVVTGADAIFIGPHADLQVEEKRKLPLVKSGDLAGAAGGNAASWADSWGGLGLINPFEPDGARASGAAAPRLDAYLERHEAALRERPYARQNPHLWWRPIDRIHASLATTPKLLIPDSKAGATIAYDPGRFYPHRTVTYVTASAWDLQALAAILRTPIVSLFIAAHTPQMRGGALRIQAASLRGLRLPDWASVPGDVAEELAAAWRAGDGAQGWRATGELYRLSREEQTILAALPLDRA